MIKPIDEAMLAEQRRDIAAVRSILESEYAASGRRRLAMIETYGCQQNEADSDRMRGMLAQMGFSLTEKRQEADLILFNTCAVREHAELKVFGNIGALKHQKAKNPNLILGITGCMMQQQHRVDEILMKYPQVDFILGTGTFFRLPGAVLSALSGGARQAVIEQETSAIPEGLPVQRTSDVRAWVTAMYGCNNFCSYCVVPYTRGREVSREPEPILEEVRGLVSQGYRDITLLGQNVNSYGRGTQRGFDFPQLLQEADKIPGEYWIRYMTSHPKDATPRLFEAMAASSHIAHQLHLPVQCGSNRVLREMNRHYTVEQYKELVAKARALMPDLTLSSDIIVGFPGETEAEFEETLALIREVEFDSLFTFAFSRRKGTKAYDMKGQLSTEEKKSRLERLMSEQQIHSLRRNKLLEGRALRVLFEAPGRENSGLLQGRTEGGKLCYVPAPPSLIGSFAEVQIREAKTFVLYGELA